MAFSCPSIQFCLHNDMMGLTKFYTREMEISFICEH